MKIIIYIIKGIYNIFKIKELRYKIYYTLIYLLIYRFSVYIPIPGINPSKINDFSNNLNSGTKGVMQIMSYFTGGAFSRASILALGIMPYISSSIIIQLIGLIVPTFQKIQKDGESGRIYMNNITRWLTIAICMLQAPAYIIALTTQFMPFSNSPNVYLFDINNFSEKTIFWIISIVILTTGTMFTMWLGEKITDKGISNGTSLIIVSGIISKFPEAFISEIFNMIKNNFSSINLIILLILEIILWLIIIVFCTIVIKAVRKIPLQYVKHINNNNNYNFLNNFELKRKYIPLKISISGVMPIIFAQAIMLLPTTLLSYVNNHQLKDLIESIQNIYGFWHNFIFSILIILFTIFYTAITMPINQISDDLKRTGGYIINVKPGRDTINYLDKILSKITFLGAILLAIIAILPSLIVKLGINHNFALFYGGTSLLIIIGVALDTFQQIDTYLLNSYYDNLLVDNKKTYKIQF